MRKWHVVLMEVVKEADAMRFEHRNSWQGIFYNVWVVTILKSCDERFNTINELHYMMAALFSGHWAALAHAGPIP